MSSVIFSNNKETSTLCKVVILVIFNNNKETSTLCQVAISFQLRVSSEAAKDQILWIEGSCWGGWSGVGLGSVRQRGNLAPGIRQEKVALHFRGQIARETSLGDALSVRAAAEATGCDWLECWTSAGVHFLLPDQGYARTWPGCWADMNFLPKTHSVVLLLVFWTKTLIQYSFSSQGSLSFLFFEATTLFSLSSRCCHLFTAFSVCSLNCCSVSLVCVVHTAVQWSSVQVTCFVHSVVVLKWLFFFFPFFFFFLQCSCVKVTCFVHSTKQHADYCHSAVVCKWHALFTL